MFESDFMEFFSHVHWSVPLWIFVPVIAACTYAALAVYELPLSKAVLVILAGLALWTFIEYSLHRFIFHYHPKSGWGQKIHWMFHGVHHDYPSDPLRLVMVPAVSLPLATAFYFLWTVLFGTVHAAPLMAGMLTGYLAYDMTHYAVHHFPIKGRVFGYLREYHMRHHFADPDRGYGVSSPLWDIILRTSFQRDQSGRS
ncbi:MAG: sterol desaturase family protein [Ignavibacteriae bacterium]|nr:sterol desaturase family protein [Ignavibacteriota bacterium]